MPRNCDIDHSLDSNGFRNIVNGSLMISYQDLLSHFVHFPLRRPPFILKEKVNYSKIRINNFVSQTQKQQQTMAMEPRALTIGLMDINNNCLGQKGTWCADTT